MYLFSTRNARDYKNLLEVYLDATFFPRLDEDSFKQEGIRFEFEEPTDPKSGLRYKGVVFNEMKGALATSSSAVDRAIGKTLFKGLPYEHISGGDPQDIPNLTWQDLRAFPGVRDRGQLAQGAGADGVGHGAERGLFPLAGDEGPCRGAAVERRLAAAQSAHRLGPRQRAGRRQRAAGRLQGVGLRGRSQGHRGRGRREGPGGRARHPGAPGRQRSGKGAGRRRDPPSRVREARAVQRRLPLRASPAAREPARVPLP